MATTVPRAKKQLAQGAQNTLSNPCMLQTKRIWCPIRADAQHTSFGMEQGVILAQEAAMVRVTAMTAVTVAAAAAAGTSVAAREEGYAVLRCAWLPTAAHRLQRTARW